MMQSFCEMAIQQKQAANIDQSPHQEMSIQEMEDLKQQYLDEMQSISNRIQIKDYRNEKIDIRYRRECEIIIDELTGKFNGMSIEINKKKELQQLEQAANLSTYTIEPLRRLNSFYDDDDYEDSTIPFYEIVSQIPPSIAITPILPTLELEDSLIMGDEDLSTILKKESDEFIKSSVKDFVPIPSESVDTSGSDSDCDLPLCNDFFPINVFEEKFVTFFNPLFDSNEDFTSSDDESLFDEDVLEEKVKIYSNPLFEFDDEYISSDVNPLFDKVLENIENKDSYVSNLDEPALLVTPLSDANEDECFYPGGDIDEIDAFLDIDVPTDIEDDYYDSEGDIIYLESLLIKGTFPNLPPEVFLDHDQRSLKDEPDKDDLKKIVKVTDNQEKDKLEAKTTRNEHGNGKSVMKSKSSQPKETVKNQFTHSQKQKVDKKELGYGFTVRACFVCGILNHLIRDCDFHEKRMARKAELNNGWNRKSSQKEIRQTWNNVQRVNKQNQFIPSAVLTSSAMKVNTIKPIVDRVRPGNVFQKTHSPSLRPFKKTYEVNTVKDITLMVALLLLEVVKVTSLVKLSLEYMETEDAQDEGRTRDVVDEEKENAEDVLSTVQQKVSTDKEKKLVLTDHNDETKLSSSQHGVKPKQFKRRRRRVIVKDIEETDRPRPTSTRSLLTLKPLPKIDPKDKGKKKIEEEDESESESDGIPEAEKKFKQLASDEGMARKEQTTYKESTKKSNDDLLEACRELQSIYDLEIQEVMRKLQGSCLEKRLRGSDEDSFSYWVCSKMKDDQKMVTRYLPPDGDYLVIYRADGNFRAFNYLMEVLHIFYSQDLFHLYDLIRDQFSEVTLDGFELILWGDLKIMMESSTEGNEQSDFWSGQQDWKIVTWRLYIHVVWSLDILGV
ncbi:hypothetical protein Tco_1378938 [Tanacetum coccineum]